MHFDYFRLFQGLLALGLGLEPGISSGQGRKSMPTAMLPIEPASPDREILDEHKGATGPLETRETGPLQGRSLPHPNGRGAAVRGGLLMTRDGFGAQLRLAEYVAPGLAVIQSLRYQTQENEDAFFASQYGLMLGLEAQAWKDSRLSPVLSLQAGGDRYRRDLAADDLDLFGWEAAAGVELKLARAASFLFQWTELYYPGLKEQLFPDQKAGTRYAGTFQVFFNLKWEGAL